MTPFLQGIAVALAYFACLGFAVWAGWQLEKRRIQSPPDERQRELIASAIQPKPEPLPDNVLQFRKRASK